MTNKGFTLVEILVAVMLTGILTTLALAPVVVTVRRVVDTQQEYTDLAALSRTMNFITRDLNSAIRLAANVITVIDHEAIGGQEDDVLMVMSNSPVVQDLPSGTLVYKIAEGGVLHGNIIPGLYRWIFPGKAPNTIKHDKLNGEDGQLVLPYVKEFCVEVPSGTHEDERRKEYSGPLPIGVYIRIKRGDRNSYVLAGSEEDERDELESLIVFP